jgi:hypothetical protein
MYGMDFNSEMPIPLQCYMINQSLWDGWEFLTDTLSEYIPITVGTKFQWKSNSVLLAFSSESFWKWQVSVE